MNTHRIAIGMMIASSAVMSLSGLLVRNLEQAGDWQIIFWRGVALAVAMFAMLFFEFKGDTLREIRRIGRLGILGGAFFAVTIVGFLLALTHTTVANTVFTMSAIPFFTAVMAWIVLGERINTATAIAIFIASAGITLMVGDGLARGSAFGNMMAILAALGFACFVVVLRKGRSVNMLPSIIVAALLSSLAGAYMANGDLVISNHDLLLCIIWGAIITGASYFLMVASSRHLRGAELTLLVLLEFILAPLWVYLFVNEVPGEMTLIGGAVVLASVSGHALVFSGRSVKKG
jgi:drug/metabolite transporter, DME family